MTLLPQRLPTGERKIAIPDHKLFIIPCQSQEEADFVCGFFNSTIGDYLIRSYALATGISTHVLDRLPIPRFNSRSKGHIQIVESAHDCSNFTKHGQSHSKAEERLNEAIEEASHFVPMSSRLTKKSFVNVSGRLVKTPCLDCPKFAPRARMPPTRTVISGAVSCQLCRACWSWKRQDENVDDQIGIRGLPGALASGTHP